MRVLRAERVADAPDLGAFLEVVLVEARGEDAVAIHVRRGRVLSELHHAEQGKLEGIALVVEDEIGVVRREHPVRAAEQGGDRCLRACRLR